MNLQLLTAPYDAAIAALIRKSLKAHHLDIPGTAYYDVMLDHLSGYYDRPGRRYYVLLEEETVLGGAGLAEFSGIPDCCELQKLYLDEAQRGRGLGYRLLAFIEDRAREMGYRQMYLETHTNLHAAIRLYEKDGFRQIERPACVIHSTTNRFYMKDL